MRSILTTSLVVLLTCTSLVRADEFFQPAMPGGDSLWVPQLFVDGKVGDDRSIGAFDLTWPLTQQRDSLLFANARLRADTEDSLESNLGLGYRFQLNSDVILGFYGFFDALRSQNENTFLQATFGAEMLMKDWQARANIYIPEDSTEQLGSTIGNTLDITGTAVSLAGLRMEEKALPGFDLEVGRRLSFLRDMMGKDMFDQIWVYGGYYYFDDSDFETIEGPRLRGEWRLPTDSLVRGSYLSLGGQWQHDDVRGSQTMFTVFFRIPLGGTTSTRRAAMRDMEWRYWAMQTPIERDVDVVTGNRAVRTANPVYTATTGELYNHIYFVSANGAADAAGTRADPFDLQTALAQPGRNIIVAIGANSEITTGEVLLRNGMTLVGGGTVLTVGTQAGANLDDNASLTNVQLPGGAATLVGTDPHLIRLANGSDGVIVGNLTLNNPNGDAVFGRNATNVLMGALTVDETSGSAVDFQGGRNLNLINFELNNTGDTAMVLRNIRGKIAINNLAIADATGGMIVDDVKGEVAFSNVSIATETGNGLDITNSSGMTWSGTNSVDATEGYALRVFNSEFTSTAFSSLTSTDSPSFGVLLNNVSGTFGASGSTTIDNPAGAGLSILNIAEDDASITFGAINTNDTVDEGVLIQKITGSDVALTLGSTSITNASSYGLRVNNVIGDNAVVTLGALTTDNTDMAGLHVQDFMPDGGRLSTSSIAVENVDSGPGVHFLDNAASVTTGQVSVTNTNADGIVIDNHDGSINLGSVNVSRVDDSGLVVQHISADDARVTIGSVSVTDADDRAVLVDDITGENVRVNTGSITAVSANRGLEISNINAAVDTRTTLIFGNVSVTGMGADGVVVDGVAGDAVDLTIGTITGNDVQDAALLLTDLTASDLSITVGNVNANQVGTAVQIDPVNAPDADINIGNVTVDDADTAVLISGATVNNVNFDLGNLNLQNVDIGLHLDGDFSNSAILSVDDVTLEDATTAGIRLSDVDGVNLDFSIGDVDLTSPGANGIWITNFLASGVPGSTLRVGDVNVDSPTNDGVLIDGVPGNNVTMRFGDTVVDTPGNTAVEQLNITGANPDITFDSIEEN
ncbi:MAG: inverse autotransporter beta domain-containing protein [Phycisphaeraceae bacterium]|nr:inverse autotransporter beta domain-containing protein [Phycisphaeraceae bacterium]